MKMTTLLRFTLTACTLVLTSQAFADQKPPSAKVKEIATHWASEETGDMGFWQKDPGVTNEITKRAFDHLKATTAKTAKDLGLIACGSDNKLADLAVDTMVNYLISHEVNINKDQFKAKVMDVSCSGNLHVSIKLRVEKSSKPK